MDVELLADPDLPLESLLPLRALVVTLEFLQPATPPFFHQAALTGYLRYLAGSPEQYDHYLRIDACESGRVRYRPGDYYRFMLVGLAGSDSILEALLGGLASLPQGAPREDAELPFRDNCRLTALQDAFTEDPVTQLDDASSYTWETLAEEVALWLDHDACTWRWLTPARLLLPKEKREGARSEARYCRDAPDLPPTLLLRRLFDTTADLLRRRGATHKAEQPQVPETVESTDAHGFWIDHQYFDDAGQAQLMGGMAGRLDLRFKQPLSPAWWRLLLLGQYLGAGQRTAFGWGRYRLTTPDGGFTFRRVLPASSLLMTTDAEDNLTEAWRHVLRQSELPPWLQDELETSAAWAEQDEVEDDATVLEPPLERLHADMQRLLEGRYPVPELRGHLLPKRDGGVRPLAVPPVYDRVLQRAVVQILAPALEDLMSRGSHGYRKGRSRITARYDIQAAWRAGYRWIYESDIDDFFDSVDLERLRERLLALYDEDPMVDRIIGWLRAPVRFHGELIERGNGLPQGSPLSPLMANLMLDDFDSDMEQAGFHLIRFADDFIVLCKDPEEARVAGETARASLAEHGLRLNKDKTRITAMEDGFRYLGYLFVNDMALDVGRAHADRTELGTPPPNSWLARLGEREPRALDRDDLAVLVQRLGRREPVAVGERDTEGTLLIVTGEPALLSTSNRHLRVHRDDRLLYDLPLSDLQAVLLLGNHHLTTPAMAACLNNAVPVHLANGAGVYRGVLWNGRPEQGYELWLRQIAAFEDPDISRYCSLEVVGARLRHMREVLRQRQLDHRLVHLERAIVGLDRIDSIDSLRGHEGRATREYFERLATVVPEEFGFSGRNRRPPLDPFNALLSLGFTVLYGYSDSILRAVGLLPWAGFYHAARGRHATLASDLMEPFRHVVERTALTLLLRRELGPDDFASSPAGACHLSDAARRKFFALLLQRFETKVRARGQAIPEKIFTHLHQQALSLKDFIVEGRPFNAWRLR